MSDWWSAKRISEQYVVGENRLMAFAARGNLPSVKDSDGRWLFDVEVVRSLFRCRDAAMAPELRPGSLGAAVLGEEWKDLRRPGKKRRGRVRRRRLNGERDVGLVALTERSSVG